MAELLKDKPARGACEETQKRRICFVCTGNTCRSPMAEAVANALLKENGEQQCEVFSRGIYAIENEPLSSGALRALEEAGIEAVRGHDFHTHTARNLSPTDVEAFDLLVGMTASHTMELLMRFPAAANRITCMPKTIEDPYGGNAEVYRRCLEQITQGVKQIMGMETMT